MNHIAARWALLIAASAVLAAALELLGLSAGLLLGPMIAAIVLAIRGRPVAVSRPLFGAAQALIGCMIAGTINAPIVGEIARDWPIFLGATLATLSASALLGYLLSRWKVLPHTVAVWGAMPGASSAMIIMADAFGADARLVAFMTYTRVVCVAAVASILAAVLTGQAHGDTMQQIMTPVPWRDAGITLAIAAAGWAIGARTPVPAAALIGPLLLGSVLNATGIFTPQPPGPLLAIAYALVGWRIGLAFTPATLKVAARALPRVLAAMAGLLGFAFAIALILSRLLAIDLVTAYLAVSPGGMDSIAIIAGSTPVDRSFVMALQTLRYLAVLIVGPVLAKFVARRIAH